MNAISLLYHDVIEPGQTEASGFPGAHAARYKLERDEFQQHLAAISQALGSMAVTVGHEAAAAPPVRSLRLTFDDGGISAHTYVADALERYGWRGYFFITTDFIGRPGFLESRHIRELRGRGHVIGSHSRSHPLRISSLSWEQMVEEWTSSIEALSDLLGEAVDAASVPGGYYSKSVARAARASGIRTLFTSEPSSRARLVEGCVVQGRYVVLHGMSPRVSARLAAGHALCRYQQFLYWNAKKLLKTIGGDLYPKAIAYLLQKRG